MPFLENTLSIPADRYVNVNTLLGASVGEGMYFLNSGTYKIQLVYSLTEPSSKKKTYYIELGEEAVAEAGVMLPVWAKASSQTSLLYVQPLETAIKAGISAAPIVNIEAPIINVPPPEITVVPPEVNVEAPIVNVPPANITVVPPEVNVEAPIVNVPPANITVVPPEVNVEAPIVNVPAPIVNVSPPNVTVNNPTEFPAGSFTGSRALTVQSYKEANAKNGTQFNASRIITSLAGGASSDTVFQTGAKPVILKERVMGYSGSWLRADIFRGATTTGGTALAVYNLSDINPQATTVSLLVNPTVTSTGTQAISSGYATGTGGSSKGAASVLVGEEKILAPNTRYLFRLTNLDSGTNTITAYVSWFEGTPDLPAAP